MSRKKCNRKVWTLVNTESTPVPAAPELFTTGIYIILCNASEKFYIGSSNATEKRIRQHFAELDRGVHHNPPLQAAYKKYGRVAFDAFAVEYVSIEDQFNREQQWLDAWIVTGRLFNTSPAAIRPPKHSELPEEIRARVSAANSARTKEMHKDPIFAQGLRRRIRELNANPDFAEANRKRSSERMLRLNANPEFKKSVAERSAKSGREVMLKLHQQPDFQARHLERLAKTNADPESRARCVEATKKANSKPCVCVWPDGRSQSFISAKQASEVTGEKQGSITYRCRTKAVANDGSRWEYL